uniref:Zinc finger, CCHC domain containing 4 n=1 Tax=Eptatretus burgeri TaxID=7764 RepID=A0A8C4NB31_EPTBU
GGRCKRTNVTVEREGCGGNRHGNSSGRGTKWRDTSVIEEHLRLCPALLFERYVNGHPTRHRFFSCSVSRDRCECELFQWERDKVSAVVLLNVHLPFYILPLSRSICAHRLHLFAALPKSQRFFCQQCQDLVLSAEQSQHAKHAGQLLPVSDAALARPVTLLLASACSRRERAQFLFSDRVTRWLSNLPLHLGFTRLLCLGTPRYSTCVLRKFYPADEFCRYNMFNNHFFRGESRRIKVCFFFFQVDYDNHVKYKLGLTGRKRSPARIFTNISPSLIPLPTEEGYRLVGTAVHANVTLLQETCTVKSARPSPTAGTLRSDSTRRHKSPTPKSACESQANLHRVWTLCPRVNRLWTRGLPENLPDQPRILHRSRLRIPGVFALRSWVIVDHTSCQVKGGTLW